VRNRSKRGLPVVVALCAGALVALFAGAGIASAVPGVEPSSVTATLNPGDSINVTKTVHTPAIPPKPDIVFLADTTSSMSGAIANVKAQAGTIFSQVLGVQALAQFGVAHYTDQNCPNPYVLDQSITGNTAAVQAAINSLSTPSVTCNPDAPEDWLNALFHVATDAGTGFRSDSTRIVVLFGDSSSHDPSVGHTEAQVRGALLAAGIKVVAVPVPGTSGFLFDGLDNAGQATRLASATGGIVIPAATANDVSTAILQGLQNLPVTVKPSPTCDPGLTATYDAASKTITSGGDVTFNETLTVDPANPGGSTLHCHVDFLLNNLSGGAAFHQEVAITVNGADLQIVKTGPSLVTEGHNLTYHLVARNNGPAAATGVVVKDTLPANSTFVSASAGCVQAAGLVTCTVGNLASGASASFDVIVTAGSAGSSLTNTATIAGSQFDPNLGNNSSTVVTTLNHNPICTGVNGGPDLWPPNHKLHLITLTGATDPDGDPVATSVTGVTQDEALNGLGDGDTGPDAFHGPASDQVLLRAERSGLGDGRVYRIGFGVTDGRGGSCSGTAHVGVPHDRGGHATAIDSGSVFVDF